MNVAYCINNYSLRIFGGSENTIAAKTIFIDTGNYLVYGCKEFEKYNTDSPIIKAPSTVFRPNTQNRRFFNKLIACSVDNKPICKRIRNTIRDLALAYNATNAGLKTLSFWRCLEHVSYSDNLKEKEVINIFKNLYKNEYWRQMGDLVCDSRNRYVHSGLYSNSNEYTDKYIYWSQRYAESALYLAIFLYDNSDKWYSEDDLRAFFENYSKSYNYLTAVGKMSFLKKQ